MKLSFKTKSLLIHFSSSLYRPKQVQKYICVCHKSLGVETTCCTPTLCLFKVCVWLLSTAASAERLWCFQDRNLQGHHIELPHNTWRLPLLIISLLLSPSVSHLALPRTAVVIYTEEMPLRKWDQAKEETKKEQLEHEASQRVGFAVRSESPAFTQKTSDRQSARPEQSSCQAFVRITCSCSTRFNNLVEGVKVSAVRFTVTSPQRKVKTFWLSFLCLQLNGA